MPHLFSPPPSPTSLPAWSRLTVLAQAGLPHLAQLLSEPALRPAPVSAEGTGLTLDFSRQAVDGSVLDALLALATQANIDGQREAMFSGQVINTTEQRAVLHVALRGTPGATGDAAPWGVSSKLPGLR